VLSRWGCVEVGTSVPAGPHRPNRQPPSPNRSRTSFAPVGTSVPAGPGSVRADMGSGTSSLREMKPDPMPAADRDGQPYLMGLGTGSGTPSLREAKPDPMSAALPRPMSAADRGRSALPDGPWHEVRQAIAARGEARPHAGGPAQTPCRRPTGDGQPYLMGLGTGSGTPSLREAKPDPLPRPCPDPLSAADRDGQPYPMPLLSLMPCLRSSGEPSWVRPEVGRA
jgi:hypothetical protein